MLAAEADKLFVVLEVEPRPVPLLHQLSVLLLRLR
jgi:hypothetical protein